MSDLSPYELRVLRQMVTGDVEIDITDASPDGGPPRGAALWLSLETLRARDLVRKTAEQGGIAYDITEAGRALVRARDAELTEAKNV